MRKNFSVSKTTKTLIPDLRTGEITTVRNTSSTNHSINLTSLIVPIFAILFVFIFAFFNPNLIKIERNENGQLERVYLDTKSDFNFIEYLDYIEDTDNSLGNEILDFLKQDVDFDGFGEDIGDSIFTIFKVFLNMITFPIRVVVFVIKVVFDTFGLISRIIVWK